MKWIMAVSELTKGQVIAIDGKTLRRSHDKVLGKEAIVMVSAWATANHLLHEDVKSLSDDLEASRFRAYDYDADRTVEQDHGR